MEWTIQCSTEDGVPFHCSTILAVVCCTKSKICQTNLGKAHKQTNITAGVHSIISRRDIYRFMMRSFDQSWGCRSVCRSLNWHQTPPNVHVLLFFISQLVLPSPSCLSYLGRSERLYLLVIFLVFPSEWINAVIYREIKDTGWAGKNWGTPTWMNHPRQFAQMEGEHKE